MQDERAAFGGGIDVSTTRKAMATDSSRVTRSGGSAGVPSPTHSVRPGSGSGIHWPTYRSRGARAEPSRSRQIRPGGAGARSGPSSGL